MTTETIRTDTHEFRIREGWTRKDCFEIDYRALNPKNGKPWQRFHIVMTGDVPYDPDLNKYRMVYYSTIELAREAVAKQIAKLKR